MVFYILEIKTDIENVLLVVGVEQYNPLMNFETCNFKIMIEKSKELLNSLYKKVLKYEIPTEKNLQTDQSSLNKRSSGILINIVSNNSKVKGSRPNYFSSDFKINSNQTILKKSKFSEKQRQKFKIEKRMSELLYNIEKITNSFDESDFIQLKFLAQYENEPLIMKVFGLLMILENYSKREEFFLKYDFEKGISSLTMEKINRKKLKKLNDMIRQEKKLNYETLILINPTIANVYQLITLIIKWFSFFFK